MDDVYEPETSGIPAVSVRKCPRIDRSGVDRARPVGACGGGRGERCARSFAATAARGAQRARKRESSAGACRTRRARNALRPRASKRDAEEAVRVLKRRADPDLEIRARLLLCDYRSERDSAGAQQEIAGGRGAAAARASARGCAPACCSARRDPRDGGRQHQGDDAV